MRKKTKIIKIGNIKIGGNNPIAIQSMTNTYTGDIEETVKQIHQLEDAGCELVRVGVPDEECAKSISKIKKRISIPLIADIHFDYKLALISIQEGIDKLRINPGNISNSAKIKELVEKCKEYKIPIRVGANSGSVKSHILRKLNNDYAKAMVESVENHIKMLHENNFDNIVVSLKSSDIDTTLKANTLLLKKYNYPLHIGITESGTLLSGSIKSSVGLGILLYNGIGDTIRVSLSANPVEEIKVCRKILQTLKLRFFSPEIISCPTCSRTQFNVIEMAEKIENHLINCTKPVTIAVMGCEVNGPGEAQHADLGVIGTKKRIYIYKSGKKIIQTDYENILSELSKIIEQL